MEIQPFLKAAPVHANGNRTASSQEILRLQIRTDEEVSATTGSNLKTYRAEILLDHIIIHIDLVFSAGNFFSLYFDSLEVTEPLETHFRLLDLQTRRWCCFQLAHLTTQDVIRCGQIAIEINSIYIGTISGLDEKRNIDSLVFVIDLRHACRFSESIAKVSKKLHHDFFSAGNKALRINLSGAHKNSSAQQSFSVYQISSQINCIDCVQITFIEVNRYINFLAIGCYGNWRRFHTVFNIAIIEIERFQPLQIARELLARIAIAATKKKIPGLGAQFEKFQQFFFFECIIANYVYMPDARFFAFIDIQTDGNSIARKLLHFNLNRGTIATT